MIGVPVRIAELKSNTKAVLKADRGLSTEYVSYLDGRFYGCVESEGEITDYGFYQEAQVYGIEKKIRQSEYEGEIVEHIDTPLSDYCEKIFEGTKEKTTEGDD